MGGLVSCQRPQNTYQEPEEKSPRSFRPVEPMMRDSPALPIAQVPVIEEIVADADSKPQEQRQPNEMTMALTMTLRQRFSVLSRFSSDEESDSWNDVGKQAAQPPADVITKEQSEDTPQSEAGLGLTPIVDEVPVQPIGTKTLASRSVVRPPPPPGTKRQSVMTMPQPKPQIQAKTQAPVTQTAPIKSNTVPQVQSVTASLLPLPPPPPPLQSGPSPKLSTTPLPKPPQLQVVSPRSSIPPPPPATSLGIKASVLPPVSSPSLGQRSPTPVLRPIDARPSLTVQVDEERTPMGRAEMLGTSAQAFLQSIISDEPAEEADLF